MIEIVTQSIFTIPAHAYVCPVYLQRNMDHGLARAFKFRYPGLETVFHTDLEYKRIQLGMSKLHTIRNTYGDPVAIIFLPVSESFSTAPTFMSIKDALEDLSDMIRTYHWTTVVVPPLTDGVDEAFDDEIETELDLMAKEYEQTTIVIARCDEDVCIKQWYHSSI